MKAAILRVSVQFLVDAMKLPPDTALRGARLNFEQPSVVELHIESPLLPDVREGAVLHHVDAIFSSKRGFERFE